MNADRRRINPPSIGTAPPIYSRTIKDPEYLQSLRPTRTRDPNELRKIFLQTSTTPSATGSAYLEISTSPSSEDNATSPTLLPSATPLKISCTIHGPHPLPRSAPFSPYLQLTTTVKFAPFSTLHRRGYIRDTIERDLGVHLETALRGIVIGERWPKSGVDVVVTVLEGTEGGWWGDEMGLAGLSGTRTGGSADRGRNVGAGWGLLNVLAAAITVSSAALVDAEIDCLDMVTGGVAALVRGPNAGSQEDKEDSVIVLDPCPSEHRDIQAACVVGYLASRDELTELWLKGDIGSDPEELVEKATQAAAASLTVLKGAVLESVQQRLQSQGPTGFGKPNRDDVEMTG